MAKSGNKTMSYDNMRIGNKYFLSNHGETTSFLVLETEGANDFKIKDLLSLDTYLFGDLVRYGLSDDFELYEI